MEENENMGCSPLVMAITAVPLVIVFLVVFIVVGAILLPHILA